jgi:hypothetical protein
MQRKRSNVCLVSFLTSPKFSTVIRRLLNGIGSPGSFLKLSKCVRVLLNPLLVVLMAFMFLQATRHVFSAAHSSTQRSIFSERFKYDVITSSLLSNSLSSSHSLPHRPASPSPPGKLSVGHSRESSVEGAAHLILEPMHISEIIYSWPETVGFALAGALFGTGYYAFAALTLGGLTYYMQTSPSKTTRSHMSPVSLVSS